VSYAFVYDKEQSSAYLRLKWKPPLYTGGSVYSFKVTSQREDVQHILPKESLYLIRNTMKGNNDDDDEFIHFEGIWTLPTKKYHQSFEITALNDNGEGETYADKTHSKFIECL